MGGLYSNMTNALIRRVERTVILVCVLKKDLLSKLGSEDSGETKPVDTLSVDFQLPDCERITFCYLSIQLVVFYCSSPSKLSNTVGKIR